MRHRRPRGGSGPDPRQGLERRRRPRETPSDSARLRADPPSSRSSVTVQCGQEAPGLRAEAAADVKGAAKGAPAPPIPPPAQARWRPGLPPHRLEGWARPGPDGAAGAASPSGWASGPRAYVSTTVTVAKVAALTGKARSSVEARPRVNTRQPSAR